MLSIRNLNSNIPTLKSINLEIAKHTVIIGNSGAGKTSLLRCIAGLNSYDGNILIDNKLVDDIHGPERNVSMVWQDGRLLPNLTVEQNIKLGGDNTHFYELVELFKLNTLLDKYPHEISGGESQRVNILRAVCSPAKVILLDEPMSGVDPVVVRKTLKQLLFKLKQLGKIAIMVTHELYQVYGLFDDVIVIKNSEVLTHDNFKNVYDNPVTPWLANFFGTYTVLDKKDLKSFDLHSNEDPCMVRPEWFKIKKPPFKIPTETNAQVVGVQWDGPSNKISLVLDRTKKPLAVEVYADMTFNVGEKVYVNFKKCSRPTWVIDRNSDDVRTNSRKGDGSRS
jgi:ABC-type Fe3+/spermidine/putrescine transport system ATPase subunit